MGIVIKHNFQSVVSDNAAGGIVKPSNWNDNHSISLAAGSLLGNSAGAAGPAQEIAVNVTDFLLNSSALALAATGIAAGIYTNPVLQVDSKGRIFAINSSANAGGAIASEHYIVDTADVANLPNARVATDATAITFDKSVAGVIKAKLGQLTGDVTTPAADSLATTIAALAVTTGKIAANAVTYAKLQTEAATTLLGNPTGSPAVPSEITLGAALTFVSQALQTLAHTGDVTSPANSLVMTIAAAAVTFAKFQNLAGLSVFGNSGSAAGVGGNITGTADQFLQVNHAGNSLGFVSMSGDATLSGGALTIAAAAVTYAKIQNGGGLSVVGRSANSAGVNADIVGTAGQVLRVSGTTLGFGTVDLSSSAAVANQLQAASMPALTGAVVSAGATLATTETIDLVVIIGNGSSVIGTGIGANWTSQFDFAATIVQWTIVADESGSISIDVLKCTYTQFDAGSTHPVTGDKISASAPITFSTATKAQDSTLSGWTKSISAGDILAFNVASVTSCKQVVINIKLTKTS